MRATMSRLSPIGCGLPTSAMRGSPSICTALPSGEDLSQLNRENILIIPTFGLRFMIVCKLHDLPFLTSIPRNGLTSPKIQFPAYADYALQNNLISQGVSASDAAANHLSNLTLTPQYRTCCSIVPPPPP